MPGVSDPEAYVPVLVVVVITMLPVALSVIMTLAPLTTAPVVSVTVPTILPVLIVLCDRSKDEESTRIAPETAAANRVRKCPKDLEFDIVHLTLSFFEISLCRYPSVRALPDRSFTIRRNFGTQRQPGHFAVSPH